MGPSFEDIMDIMTEGYIVEVVYKGKYYQFRDTFGDYEDYPDEFNDLRVKSIKNDGRILTFKLVDKEDMK